MARIRGLAKLDKHNPGKVEWNQYALSRARPKNRTQTLLTAQPARNFCDRHNAKLTLGFIGEVVPILFEDAVREYRCSLGFGMWSWPVSLDPGDIVRILDEHGGKMPGNRGPCE